MSTVIREKQQLKKYSHLLDTEHLQADLKDRSIRGGAVILMGQGAKFLLNVSSMIILARLLTPSDFGLIAMVAPITGFLGLFQDLGLSMATIQQKEINHAQVSGLFWINVLVSLVITVLCFALAPLVARFYGDGRLTGITMAMGSLFIISGLTTQHIAILRRQMRFSRLVVLDTFSNLIGVISAVFAGALGAGYWSLIFLSAVGVLTNMVGAWLSTKWIPGLMQRKSGLRPLVAFGGGLTGFNIMNYFARNLDNVLIGQVWGENSLGLYSRAYSFLVMPIQQVNGPISCVATPALSRLQDDPVRFKSYFCKVLRISTFITFPFIAYLVMNSRDIIIMGFGKQWEPMIPIYRILSISAFAQVIGNMTGILYSSLGLGKRMLRWGVMGSSWLMISFFIGIPYGAKGVAFAYSSAIILMLVPCIIYAIHKTPILFNDIVQSIWQNALFAIIALGATYIIVNHLFVYVNEWVILLGSGLLLLFIYIFCHIMSLGSYKNSVHVVKSYIKIIRL